MEQDRAEALKLELAKLREERSEAARRLRELYGRPGQSTNLRGIDTCEESGRGQPAGVFGRGRGGRGGGAAGGPPGSSQSHRRGFEDDGRGGGPADRSGRRRVGRPTGMADRGEDDGGPPAKRQRGRQSAGWGAEHEQRSASRRGGEHDERHRRLDTIRRPRAEDDPRDGGEDDRKEAAMGGTNRPPAEAIDEGTKKRGRRMLAGLLGTLRQFDREEKKHSDVTAQRRVILEQAEERARETSQRLYARHRGSVTRRRAEEAHGKALLDVKLAEKELELLAHTHRDRVAAFGTYARTREGNNPRVYYKPRTHTEATIAAVERHAAEMDAWRDSQTRLGEGKLTRAREAAAARARELEAAEAAAEDERSSDGEGDRMDDAGEDGGRSAARGDEDVRGGGGEEETRGGGGDIGEDDQEEEGEVLPERVEDRKGRNEDEDLMGDIEDAANPEELEEMLGRPDE